MTVATDLHRLSEDARIKVIGRSVMNAPASSADRPPMNCFVVESQAKADRYVRKLKKAFPRIRILNRTAGPVAGTFMVTFAGPLK
jgi:hypothetical protein